MNRYYITETQNGFKLTTEWDCENGQIDQLDKVFQERENEDGLSGAFDRMCKDMRGKYEN